METDVSGEAAGYYGLDRREMRQFLPERYTRVLEVGCGEGLFSASLDGAERWGVEPNDAAATRAASRLDTVLRGRYAEVESGLPDAYFDVVVCNDVIEHVADHEAFLRSVRTKLRDGGHLVASIPNVRHVNVLWDLLVHKEWEYRDSGILDATHLRFFTEKSLRRAVERQGFAIEAFGGINRSRTFKARLVLWAVIGLTAGYYADTAYVQFGLRARKV